MAKNVFKFTSQELLEHDRLVFKTITAKFEKLINKLPVKSENYDWHIGAMWGLNKGIIVLNKFLGDEKDGKKQRK